MFAILLLIVLFIALVAWRLLLTKSEHQNQLATFFLHRHNELYEHPSLLNKHFAQEGQKPDAAPLLPKATNWPQLLRSLALPLLLLVLLTCTLKFWYLD